MAVPDHVISYVRETFAGLNDEISRHLCALPTTQEAVLDHMLIGHLMKVGRPTALADGWVVQIQTHFLGGMRHWHRWEIADIGILVMFRGGGRLLKTKAAGFQSKRLYPNEVTDPNEEDEADYGIGFARLYRDEGSAPEQLAPRTFGFSEESKYRALVMDDEQQKAITAYTEREKIPIYYLLYNPAVLPWRTELPASRLGSAPEGSPVGCRVVPFRSLVNGRTALGVGKSPSYAEVVQALRSETEPVPDGGWRLEHFVADRLVGCIEGYKTTKLRDEELYGLFTRRSGPIAAAFAITIQAPDGSADMILDENR